MLAPELNADNGCGGFLSASAGGSEVSYSGGSLAAGAACTIAVDVTSAIAGSYSNDMVNVTSSLGTSAAAEATLTVNEVPLSVSMSFEPPMIGQGGVSRLSYVLRNGALIPATSVALSDRLPADVVLAPELNADNGCGGFLSASAGGSEVSYSGGSLAAGAACTIAVDVTSAIAGSYSNDMVNVTSSLGTSAAAEATLTVNEVPLSVSMSFVPPMIDQGGVSRLSYVLRNGALIPATSVALSDRLPADVVLAPELNADNGCGGFLSASAGGSEVSYSGGSLAAGAACTIAVDVTSAIAGSYSNDMVNVTSSLGTSAAAEATLTVNEVPLSVSMSFVPPMIDQGGVSRLSYVLRNGALIPATSVALSDRLPADVVLAPELNADNGCGGFLSASAGGSEVSYSGGSLAAGAACTIAVDVTSAIAGSYSNDMVNVTSSLGTSAAAEATLTVNEVPLSVSMSFEPPMIGQGGVSRLSYVLRNGALIPATSVALSDRLPADVVLAPELNADNGCGGFLSASAGGSEVSYSGGSLAAGAACTIAVDVTSAIAGSYSNDMVNVTSSLGTSAAAEATLTVNEVPLSVSMSFEPPMIGQGGVSRLSYVLRNGALIPATSVALSDRLPADVVLAPELNADNGCGGFLSASAGGSEVSYSGGSLAAGAACTIAVDVTSAIAGSYSNDMVNVTSSLGTSAAAEATLTVNEVPLSVSMSFEPPMIGQGGVSRLSYVLRNGALIPATSVALSDRLPADVVLAPELNADNGCGGFLSASAGGSEVSYSGGSLAAGAACTIAVDVTSAIAGSYSNDMVNVTSSLGTSAAAEATLTVNEVPLSVSMSFVPPMIDQGGVSRLSYVLRNGALIPATSVALSDRLPADVVLAPELNADNGCGGFLSASAGGSEVSYSGGSLAAGAACTIAVDVTSAIAGSYSNDMVNVTSSLGTSAAAEATLTVNEVPLSVSMSFVPPMIGQGGVSRLSYVLRNGALIPATSVALSDRLPADVVLAPELNADNGCGGFLSASAGGSEVSYSGGSLAAGAACTIAVDVTSAIAGSYSNDMVNVTSSLGTSAAAEATLTVNEVPLSVSMSFEPPMIGQGGVSRLSYVLRNGALIPATSVALSDRLPADVVLAPELNADNGCGGFLSASAGGSEVSYSGGSLAAGAACTIAVDVTSAIAGSYSNDMVNVTSSLGTSAAAEATLTVNEVPLSVSMSFEPPMIGQGGVSRLSYVLRNGALIPATSVALSDRLPADVVLAPELNADNGCGGFLSASAGGSEVSYSGGSLAAGAACTIAVDVTSAIAGSYSNDMVNVTSSLGTSAAAEATLTVNEVPLSVSMSFEPPMIDQGGVSRLSYVLRNGALIPATSVALSDRLPADVVLAPELNADNGCGGFLSASAGGSEVSYSGGSLAAGAACTIAVDVTSAIAGSYSNDMVNVTSSLGTSAAAEATLTVDPADAPGFARVFEPDTIPQGGETEVVFTVDNGANAIEMTEMAFDASLPEGVSVADTPGASNSCGGTFSPVAGAARLALTGGTLAAGATCEIRVTVRAIEAGPLIGPAVDLSSSIATATAAEAMLMVDAAAALGFAKAFLPDTVDPGGVSRLTYRIDNAANLIDVGSLSFDDDFPEGLAVAPEPNADNTCGGTFAPAASATSLVFSGGLVAAGGTCTLAVDVQALVAGTLTGTSGDLTSDLLVDAPGVSATLTVREAPLSVSMAFEPSTIGQGGVSRLTYGLNNGEPVAATSVALSDTLPTGVVVADPPDAQSTCTGGTLTAAAGGGDVSYSGGSLAAATACTIAVDVTSVVAGSHLNRTERVTSSLGTSAAAEAMLTVDPAGTVTFNVESDTDGIFNFSSAEPVLTVSLEVDGGTGSTGALVLATGRYSVAVAAPTGVALTAIACDDTDSTADVSAAAMISVTVDAAEAITCTLTAQSSVQPTVEAINSFLTRRADLILSSESDANRRFERLNHGSGQASALRYANGDLEALVPFTVQGGISFTGEQGGNGGFEVSTSLLQVRQAAASAALASGSAGDVAYVENYRFGAWFEAQYKQFGGGSDEHGDFAIAYFGMDYLVKPDVLVGALVSLDTMEEVTDTSTVSGFGYMIGPYVTARLASYLYFDGHVAVGQSDNRISPFNTYTDTFRTGRWLARASLTGEARHGNWTIRPHARLGYFEETQQRYTDSVGATIPSQTVRLGQLKIGPTFTGRFEGPEGWTWAPYLEVEGIYNIGNTTGVTLTDTNGAEVEGWRARLKAGVGLTTGEGTRLSLGATHDGLGRSDFENWGLKLELSIPFGKPKR